MYIDFNKSGLLIILLASISFWVISCSGSTALEQRAEPHRSTQISECNFRILLSQSGSTIDFASEEIIRRASVIVRRTGFLLIRGTYSPDRGRASAASNAGVVQSQFIAQGVPAASIRVVEPIDHEPASRSGAWIRVCAPNKNVENSWRSRPLDPARGIIVRVGSALFQIPVLNMGPYIWNDEPVAVATITQFFLDRNDDATTFADILNECWRDRARAMCARVIAVSLGTSRPSLPHEAAAAAFTPPESTYIDANEDRVVYTQRVRGDFGVETIAQCQSGSQPERPSSANLTRGDFVCTAVMSLPHAGIYASLVFNIESHSLLSAILERLQRAVVMFYTANARQ